MNIVQMILTPAISIALGWLIAKVKSGATETNAIKKGLQAILRDRLLQSYKYYESRGWAGVDDRSNWENMYTQYHSLGANGVMDDVREKFLALPINDKGVR